MLLVLMPRPRRAHVLSLGLDFGLARVTREGLLSRWPTSTSAAGVIVGTPAYLAPEQIRGLPIDERVDLYAAGVILFEALTRRLPFLGSEYEVLTAHVGEPPPSPRAMSAPTRSRHRSRPSSSGRWRRIRRRASPCGGLRRGARRGAARGRCHRACSSLSRGT